MAAVAGKCTTWNLSFGGCSDLDGQGNDSQAGIASLNGGKGVSCTYYTESGEDEGCLCFPTLTGNPTTGTVMTVTNPSGHPGDPTVSGTVNCPQGGGVCTITLCPPGMADQ